MFKLDFKIFQLPATGNTYLNMHFMVRDRYNKEWYRLVFFETIGKIPPKPLAKCSVRIERYSARIQIDADNFLTGSKPIFDALTVKHTGIIMDDNLEVMGIPKVSFHKIPAKGSPYIHVFIEELPS